MSVRKTLFRFKQFSVSHAKSSMKVGTDAVVLGACVDADSCQQALDVGTGSGVIALMLAQRFPQMLITGLDIHSDSVQEAQENFRNSPWASHLQVKEMSLQNFKPNHTFDLVVSNPPFFSEGYASPKSDRAKARHTHTLSHEELIRCSSEILSEQGSLAVILPADSENRFEALAFDYGFHPWRKTYFKSKMGRVPERMLLQVSKTKTTKLETTELVHYDDQGNWSGAYKALTKEFYLRV